jgi:lysophospholipase L1-like esterase
VFGDSIIQLGLWEELNPQLQIHNRGISGDRSIDALNRIEDVLELSPKKCIIYLGINDVIHNISIQETIRNIEKIILILKDNDVKVYLVELFNLGEYKIPGFSQHVSQLNAEYSNLAQTLKIDFLRCGGRYDQQIAFLNADGIHLNGLGYSTLATIIRQALN